jgi:probable phosphoglycerate mutase
MLNIYLARHGQDEDNAQGILNGRRDRPLTAVGISQAKESAEKIKAAGLKFDKIFASPLQRAYQTAEIVADSLGMEKPEKLNLLAERNFGIMTGLPHTKIKEICSPGILETQTATYFLSPKGAETFPQLIERAKKIIDFLNSSFKEGNILLVSHGDIGKMIYAAYYGLGWQQVLEMFHFGNSELLLLSPKSPAQEAHIFKITQYNA